MNDIIATERRNTDKIYLYLEGIFWKVYERSAFAFIHRISRYKPSKRFVKYLDTEIVSLGFPDASRTKVLGDRPLISAEDDRLVLETGTIGVEEYERWKEALPLIVPKGSSLPTVSPVAPVSRPVPTYTTTIYGDRSQRQVALPPVPEVESVPRREPSIGGGVLAQPSDRSIDETVLRDLRNFSVEDATPLECLIFVSSLKKQLNGNIR